MLLADRQGRPISFCVLFNYCSCLSFLIVFPYYGVIARILSGEILRSADFSGRGGSWFPENSERCGAIASLHHAAVRCTKRRDGFCEDPMGWRSFRPR